MDEEFRKLVTMFERAGNKTGYLKMFSEEELKELSLNAAIEVWQKKGYKVLKTTKKFNWHNLPTKEFPELKIHRFEYLEQAYISDFDTVEEEIKIVNNDYGVRRRLRRNEIIVDDEESDEDTPNLTQTLFISTNGVVCWGLTEELPKEIVEQKKEKLAKTTEAKKKKDLSKLKEKQAKLEKELAKLAEKQKTL